MDIDTPRGRLFSSSKNNSRESLTYSKTSSIPYHKRMEIQNFNTSQSKQIENNKKERLSFSYATSKVEEGNMVNKIINSPNVRVLQDNNETPALNNLPYPQGDNETNNTINMCNS